MLEFNVVWWHLQQSLLPCLLFDNRHKWHKMSNASVALLSKSKEQQQNIECYCFFHVSYSIFVGARNSVRGQYTIHKRAMHSLGEDKTLFCLVYDRSCSRLCDFLCNNTNQRTANAISNTNEGSKKTGLLWEENR